MINHDREARRYRELGLVPLVDQDRVPGLDVAVALLKELDVPAAKVAVWVDAHRGLPTKLLEPIETS